MPAEALNGGIHIPRSVWLVLFGSVVMGILFYLCWISAAYGRIRLASEIVHWVTATNSAAMSALYRGLLYSLGVGAAAGAFAALLDRTIRKQSRP